MKPGLAGHDQLAAAADVGGHRHRAGRHRLDHHVRQALVERREREHVHRRRAARARRGAGRGTARGTRCPAAPPAPRSSGRSAPSPTTRKSTSGSVAAHACRGGQERRVVLLRLEPPDLGDQPPPGLESERAARAAWRSRVNGGSARRGRCRCARPASSSRAGARERPARRRSRASSPGSGRSSGRGPARR